MSDRAKRFPILGAGFTIPWAMIAPCEPQAMANHDQSLDVLASRGGLDPVEALCVLHGLSWRKGRESWPNPDATLREKAKRFEAGCNDAEVATLRAQLDRARAALRLAQKDLEFTHRSETQPADCSGCAALVAVDKALAEGE